jgi:hypothetical protein
MSLNFLEKTRRDGCAVLIVSISIKLLSSFSENRIDRATGEVDWSEVLIHRKTNAVTLNLSLDLVETGVHVVDHRGWTDLNKKD